MGGLKPGATGSVTNRAAAAGGGAWGRFAADGLVGSVAMADEWQTWQVLQEWSAAPSPATPSVLAALPNADPWDAAS